VSMEDVRQGVKHHLEDIFEIEMVMTDVARDSGIHGLRDAGIWGLKDEE